MLHCFVSKLDHAMQVDLEAVRKSKLTLQGTTIKWMDVVVLARDKLT